jgi:chromosome partitioning protein
MTLADPHGGPMTKATFISALFRPITRTVAQKLAFLTESISSSVPRLPGRADLVGSSPELIEAEFFSIAMLNAKGGSGKSTAAISLAAAAHLAGERAVILDADVRQQTVYAWGKERKRAPEVFKCRIVDVSTKIGSSRKDGVSFLIVDTPGQDVADATAVVSNVDLVLVPVAPTWVEYHATLPLLTRLSRESVPHAVLLTRVNRQRVARNEKFRAAFQRISPVLDSVIYQREIFSDSAGVGRTIFEFGDKAAREAASEVSMVYRELRSLMESPKND